VDVKLNQQIVETIVIIGGFKLVSRFPGEMDDNDVPEPTE
jgi:hypothetical protein